MRAACGVNRSVPVNIEKAGCLFEIFFGLMSWLRSYLVSIGKVDRKAELAMTLRSQNAAPPRQSDAVLIWPRGGNTGDMLILEASERYLSDRGIIPWLSDGSIEEAALAEDWDYINDFLAGYRGLIVFPGGGNVGIYPDNEKVRNAVIMRLRSRHRCLVLPQSVAGPEASLAQKNVTVWCRDRVSQQLLVAAGVNTALVPDIALYQDDRIPKPPIGHGTFYIRRPPGGDSESIQHGLGLNWPSDDLTYRHTLLQIRATLACYETVVSDRLHGGLIALMMRRKVILLPVGYHKIQAFYETWLTSFRNVRYAATPSQITEALATMESSTSMDLTSLFCSFADPALNTFLLDV